MLVNIIILRRHYSNDSRMKSNCLHLCPLLLLVLFLFIAKNEKVLVNIIILHRNYSNDSRIKSNCLHLRPLLLLVLFLFITKNVLINKKYFYKYKKVLINIIILHRNYWNDSRLKSNYLHLCPLLFCFIAVRYTVFYVKYFKLCIKKHLRRNISLC